MNPQGVVPHLKRIFTCRHPGELITKFKPATFGVRSSIIIIRKLVEGLLEILPKWCVQKMFAREGSQWFTTNLPKIQSTYQTLVLEVLLPVVGDEAEKMAHVMIAKYPNLLMIPQEVLQDRFSKSPLQL